MLRAVHYFSGIVLTVFVGLHLLNHLVAIFGESYHIETMNVLRGVYRHLFVETVLLTVIFVQIISGLKLYQENRKTASSFFEKLHIWTGLYMSFFFVFHVSAILFGRLVLDLDTNFYFGATGINTFPFTLFFVVYYWLAIFSFFGHIAAIHQKKMRKNIAGLTPMEQSKIIIAIGLLLPILIFYGQTNGFQGVEIPKEYYSIIGR